MTSAQANCVPSACENIGEVNGVTNTKENVLPPKSKRGTNWLLVLFYIYLHLTAIYAVILILLEAHWATTLLAVVMSFMVPLGMTMGAHRLWAHSSYQASTTLRSILLIFNTFAAQGSVYDWVLEHRLHHKLRGTSLDPFDARRGFLFAHFHFRLVDRLPQLEEEEKKVDMSDLEKDSLVMFQKRFYYVLMPVLLFLLVNAPVEYWGESLLTSFCVVGILRHVVVLNVTSLIHSAPLVWGSRSGENESDSNLIFFLKKSRWHDYHYMLPWDYRTSEFGTYDEDWATRLIQRSEHLGWASNLRTCTNDDMKEAIDVSIDKKISIQESIEQILTSRTNSSSQNKQHNE